MLLSRVFDETPLVIPSVANKPPMWERFKRICGFDYQAPIGATENLKETFGIVGSVRRGFQSIFSTKR